MAVRRLPPGDRFEGEEDTALKEPGQRRRYNQPAHGEWVDLPDDFEPPLPPYPAAWFRHGQREYAIPKWMWELWRADPVTSQWTPADVATALELGARFYHYDDATRFRIQTALGLNARGRRDLRWRVARQTEKTGTDAPREERRLRIVGEEPA